ncbi:MAG TPA: hypothetical protein EYP16_02355 [Candidatus Atribacteria bacterium]|nr:hypothetical protein [Candidatus Atribacteria bacterium]
MGIVYGHKKEYDKATASYQKAVEINPKKGMIKSAIKYVYFFICLL